MHLRHSAPAGRRAAIGLPIRLRVRPAALRVAILLAALPALLTIVAVGISLAGPIGIGTFTRDPAVLTNANPFWGVLSNVGVLFWCATVAICWFGALAGRALGCDRELGRLLLGAGALTAALLLDDLFLLHEVVVPTYLHLGEKVLTLGYALALAALAWRFRRVLAATDALIGLAALGLLGLSVVADRLPLASGEWIYFLEDAPKLFGIVAWCAYWSLTAWRAIVVRPPHP